VTTAAQITCAGALPGAETAHAFAEQFGGQQLTQPAYGLIRFRPIGERIPCSRPAVAQEP
jgi:hypothetical protein